MNTDDATVPHGEAKDPTRQDQALYHFLVDSLTEYAVFAVSATGTVISWNAGAEKTFGYTENEILGEPFEVIFTQSGVKPRPSGLGMQAAHRLGSWRF